MAKKTDNFQKREGRTIGEVAERQVITFVGIFGVEDAERLAKLIHEKIIAMQKLLQEKTNENGQNNSKSGGGS